MFKRIQAKDFYPIWEEAAKGRGCHIVDVRTPAEFAAGHVPGARLMALETVPVRMQEFPKDKPVYLICRSGARSAQAAQFLAANGGFTNLINIEGGTMAWAQAGYPVEQ